MKKNLHLLLAIAFFDYFGFGLVYPIFSALLFDQSFPMVPLSTSMETRGFILGLLVSMMPLCQFLTAPLWGHFSDIKGKKKLLVLSLFCGLIGYGIAMHAIAYHSLALLLLSRAFIGISSGNTGIIQSYLSSLGTKEKTATHLSLYSMVIGIGFTLGPLCGGILSTKNYFTPFLFTFILLSCNFILGCIFLEKDAVSNFEKKAEGLNLDFYDMTKFSKSLLGMFAISFIFQFGWGYFIEFIPVYLLEVMRFSKIQMGYFYLAAGIFYALSAAFLNRPFLKLYSTLNLLQKSLMGGALFSFLMIFASQSFHLWPVLFFLSFFISIVSPAITTWVSQNSLQESQGKNLGILSSINSLALIIAPVLAGSLSGYYPKTPIVLCSITMLLAALMTKIQSKKISEST